MKKITPILLIALFTLGITNIQAQKVKKTASIIIKTSAQCEMCKTTLEKGMAYEKGVISSNLNIETAELTVKYKVSKTSPEKIKQAISDTGYDADGIAANQKTYNNLPNCCQKGGMDH
mgnify:CR=1 FL=1